MKNKKTVFRRGGLSGRLLDGFLDFIFFISGSFIAGVGIHMFALPNEISNGGATGAATIINYIFPSVPVGAAMLIFNIPLFLLAFVFLGRGLFVKSFIATVTMSLVTDIIAPFVPHGTGDRLLAAIFYGVCMGTGVSLILMRGATSGGSDIVGKLIVKKFPHISLGRAVFFADCVVVVASGIVFGSVEDALYAAIVVFITGGIIDMVTNGMVRARAYLIVTVREKEIIKAVTENMGRGISVTKISGGYTGEEKSMLICAVRNSETARINRIIYSTDPSAFTIALEACEVTGEGFKIREGEQQ